MIGRTTPAQDDEQARRAGCVRRTRWRSSEPTLTSDPAGSPGVFPIATDGSKSGVRGDRARADASVSSDASARQDLHGASACLRLREWLACRWSSGLTLES
jgi:hypothetical protein